ncbi:MAG: PQQ-dependent sugar dehydrogenase [Alkalispirochaetaceae bacterium]
MAQGRTVALLLGLTLLTASVGAEVYTDDTLVTDTIRSEEEQFRVRRLVGGLEHPWSVAFLPSGEFLITERPGRLILVEGDGVSTVEGLPEIAAIGQGGLLDLALDPEFEENRTLYFTYSSREESGFGTRLARGELRGSRLRNVEVLFQMESGGGAGHHFGSRVVVGPDGALYMSIGDRGDRLRAQDPEDHAGKVLRIGPDGDVPRDNPFLHRRDARPELFTLGNRNIQGMTVHPESGEIWSHEHGPRGGDEVNILRPGVNYGWPEVTYGREYSGGEIGQGARASGFREPLLHWTPSIAPSGMVFYRGEAFADWEGDLFVGALAGRHLRRVELRSDRPVSQEELLSGTLGRIRDVRVGPDGLLYLLTDADNGGLFRLEPSR